MAPRRKIGERAKDGRLKPKPTYTAISGVLWQRLLRDRRDGLTDPRATSEIARLHGNGEITNQQAVLALKIGEIYGRFERLIGRSRSVKGFSYEVGFSGLDLPTEEQEAARDARERKARESFDNLQSDMAKLGVSRALKGAIESLCVEDQHVLPVLLPDIRRVFDALILKWKINGGTKRGGARANSGPRAAVEASTRVVEKSTEPATPKANYDRIAVRQLARGIIEGKIGPEDSWEFFRAAKDKLIHRAQADSRRIERGAGPAYVPPSTDITTTAVITDRPVLALPGQQEHA